MRTIAFTILVAAVVLGSVLVSRAPVALADVEAAPLSVPEHADTPILVAKTLPEPVLAVEVLQALRYWSHQDVEVLRPWANAIADVACDRCSVVDDVVRADAIWLASQASVETRFVPEVLDYRCNDRSQHWRECDDGWAVGPWQMHDLRMINAAPEVQARRALQWMRARPQAWTTWKAARSQARSWLAAHP